ncbi:MAG: hypothetical protein A3F11_07635 [Gammaproteobacteria bacterium RIFCSPHIGHO2_12_FULL_37_14]|nr:MAG: hypothetical protein A3F11_07635 [Gammaproteobacteria bacterium RIFCSPHIGHO2_12_FULL_37_14]
MKDVKPDPIFDEIRKQFSPLLKMGRELNKFIKQQHNAPTTVRRAAADLDKYIQDEFLHCFGEKKMDAEQIKKIKNQIVNKLSHINQDAQSQNHVEIALKAKELHDELNDELKGIRKQFEPLLMIARELYKLTYQIKYQSDIKPAIKQIVGGLDKYIQDALSLALQKKQVDDEQIKKINIYVINKLSEIVDTAPKKSNRLFGLFESPDINEQVGLKAKELQTSLTITLVKPHKP